MKAYEQGMQKRPHWGTIEKRNVGNLDRSWRKEIEKSNSGKGL